MITIDSSALIAIAKGEEEKDIFADVIGRHTAAIGAPTLLETYAVLYSLMRDGADAFIDDIVANSAVRVTGFDEDHYRAAAQAFRRYGKGQGHPAQLNFGDCMSYAVAKLHGAPLLYKGEDFIHTDIPPAYRP